MGNTGIETTKEKLTSLYALGWVVSVTGAALNFFSPAYAEEYDDTARMINTADKVTEVRTGNVSQNTVEQVPAEQQKAEAVPLLKNSIYNPITKAEWDKFFNDYCNLSQLPQEQRGRARELFQKVVADHPYYRRLIREQNSPFHITYSQSDKDYMRQNNAGGFQSSGQNKITVDFTETDDFVANTLYHEMRHRQQEKEGLWLRDSTRSNVFTANKVCEAEALNITAETSPGFNDYFKRLKNKYVQELQDIPDDEIPYEEGLTAEQRVEARNLYIEMQAHERANGEAINVLMQPNGYQTALAVADLGLNIKAGEIEYMEDSWRQSYKQQAAGAAWDSVLASESGDETLRDADAHVFRTSLENRIPSLKGTNYFQPGLTPNEMQAEGLPLGDRDTTLQAGITYFPNTSTKKTETVANNDGTFLVKVFNNQGTQIYSGNYDAQGIRHGTEEWRDDDGNIMVSRSFNKGKSTGRTTYIYDNPENAYKYSVDGKKLPVFRYEQEFSADGHLNSQVYFDASGRKIYERTETITDGVTKKICQDFENNKAVRGYSQEDGKDKSYWETKDGIRTTYTYIEVPLESENANINEQKTDDENNQKKEVQTRTRTAQIEYQDEATGKILYRDVSLDQNSPYSSPLLKRIMLDENGNDTSENGYVKYGTDTKYGYWVEKDAQGNDTQHYYTGRTNKNGEPERFTNPAERFQTDGYQVDSSNPNRFTRQTSTAGISEVICLNEKTGLISTRGQVNAEGNFVGEVEVFDDGEIRKKLEIYDKSGKLVSKTMYDWDGETKQESESYDANGKLVSKTIYADDGKTKKSLEETDTNGLTTTTSFRGDGITPEVKTVMRGEEFVQEHTFYPGGQVAGVQYKDHGTYFSIRGEITSEWKNIQYKGNSTKTTFYYTTPESQPIVDSSKHGSIRAIQISCPDNSGRYEVYRKNGQGAGHGKGSILKLYTWGTDEKGMQTIYSPTGLVRARGAVDEQGKRNGRWEYPRRGHKVYRDGIEVSRSITNELTNTKDAKVVTPIIPNHTKVSQMQATTISLSDNSQVLGAFSTYKTNTGIQNNILIKTNVKEPVKSNGLYAILDANGTRATNSDVNAPNIPKFSNDDKKPMLPYKSVTKLNR